MKRRQEAIRVKVKFQYLISGKVNNFKGEVVGEGKDYESSMQDAYHNVCNQSNNQYLTVTFKKMN